jgi:DNA-binding NtrC family response regulator
MPKKEIESEAIKELQQVNWTGNVREFRNIIERLIILCPKTIDKDSVKVYANPQFTA